MLCVTDSEYYTDLTLAALESKTTLLPLPRQNLINIIWIDELIPVEKWSG